MSHLRAEVQSLIMNFYALHFSFSKRTNIFFIIYKHEVIHNVSLFLDVKDG